MAQDELANNSVTAVLAGSGTGAKLEKWEKPLLLCLSADTAENSGNTGDDGPGASS